MKVKIGKYPRWIGPFQIAELVFFWCKKYPSVEEQKRWDYKLQDKFGDFLAYGFNKEAPPVGKRQYWDRRDRSWFDELCEWIHKKQKRTVKVRIDDYDTWNMDDTLAHIIYPMLLQLKKDKHGAPFVDDEDVPEELKSTSAPPKENEYDTDDNHFKRWDYVLDEMIWAFEQYTLDKEVEFWIEEPNGMYWEQTDNNPNIGQLKYDKEGTYDHESAKAYEARRSNGYRLFGKYYSALWD